MAKRLEITAQMLDDLFVDAMGGDWQAEQEYRDLARKLAKRSNQQMLEQERRDVTGEAWRTAQDFLGGDPDADRGARFRENNKNMDLETLRDMVDAMEEFTNARDYSIPYARESRDQIDDLMPALADAGLDVSDDRTMFWMNELFKTKAWQEVKKANSREGTGLIQLAADAFRMGKTVDDLLTAYNQYTETKDGPDLVQVWTSFVGTW